MTVYRVQVGGREYEVTIEDVNARPVRATVNGQTVQVWPPEPRRGAAPVEATAPPATVVASPTATAAQPGVASASQVRAPMPGVIVDVLVQPGDRVEVGADLCVLDAMKMNNRIRATRAGTVAQVHVNVGQQVQYGDLLVTFAEA